MKNKKALVTYLSLGVIVAAVCGVLAVGMTKSGKQNYNSVTVQKMDLTETAKTTGSTKPALAVDLSFETSGKVSMAPVKEGMDVKKGQLLAALASADVLANEKSVQAAYDAAKIALEKLKQPPEAIDLLTAKDAVSQATDAKNKANDDLIKIYDSNESAIADTYLDLQTAMSGLKDILHGNDFSLSQENIDYYADAATAYGADGAAYRLAAENSYETAKTAFDKSSDDFKSIGSDPTSDALAVLLAVTYDTTKQAADAIKNTGNLIDLFMGKLVEKQIAVPAAATAERAQLTVFATQMNSHFAALNAGERSVKSADDAVAASARVLSEREEALRKLQNGAEDIDIRAAQTRVDAAAAALSGAQNAVRKTALVAPFAGTVTKVNVAVGEFASPGAPAVSLISSAGFELETNVSEIDVGKISSGAKANVSIDTIGSNEIFKATVISVDSAATNINGVNSYHVILAFDENDPRFKSGLTANISFLIGEAKGALAVPARSIITTGDQKSVLLVNGSGVTETRAVTVGAIGDNGFVQIVSGLSEGDKIVSFGGN